METITFEAKWTLSTIKSLKRLKFTRVCIRRTDNGLDEIFAFALNSAFKHDGMPILIIRKNTSAPNEEPCHFWVNVDDLDKVFQFCTGKSKFLIFNYERKENTVQIVGDRRATIKTDPSGDEFSPNYSLKPESRSYRVDFANELPHVIKAVGKDDARPEFTGIYFDGRNLVSCDGHRLSISNVCCDTQTPDDEEPTSLIIPQDVANIIIEFGKQQLGEETLVYSMEQGDCLYTSGELSLFFEIIPGTFPNFKKVVPEKFNFEFNARIDRLIDAIAPAVKGMICPLAKIEGQKDKLKFTIWESKARKGRARCETKIEFDAEIDGDASGMVFRMDMRFLLDALKSQFFAIRMQLIDQDSPCVIRGSNGINVIMPIQI